MNAGKHDHIRIRLFCLLSKPKTVADIIRHVLYIRLLVVVGQQNGIFFFFQFFDLRKQVKGGIKFYIKKPCFFYIRLGRSNISVSIKKILGQQYSNN